MRTNSPSPGRAEIARVIPPWCRRLRGRRIERQYLEVLGSHPELLGLRADARRNTLEVAKWLGRRASWADGTTWHTREARCELAGVSVSTWKACRRRLEAWGFLRTVREGTTQQYSRAMALADPDAPGEAAVYVLCIPRSSGARGTARPPAPAITRPPTPERSEVVKGFAREQDNEDPAPAGAHLPAVAREMRKGPGQSISDGWIRHLAQPFAAWPAREVRYAIDHDPAGPQHRRRLDRVQDPVPWLRARLQRWLEPDPTGAVAWKHRRPRPSHAEQLAAANEQLLAGQAAEQADAAAAAAAAVDPGPHARAIRAEFGWKPRGGRP